MNDAKYILLIRLRSIGDIVFTLPAVHRVRENFPGARIAFMVTKEYASLLEGFREVNEVLPLDRALYRRGNPIAIVAETVSLLRRLRRTGFNLTVDFQGYGETAWLSRLTGAAERWGSVHGPGRRWAYTHGVTRDYRPHHVDWNLSLLQQCGLPPGKVVNQYVLPEAALTEGRAAFAAQKLDPARPTIYMQPFTSSPHKNWPLGRYLEVARHWQQRGVQIAFGGGPGDRATLEPARAAGFAVLAGTPLLVSGALMKLSTLVLSGDTGLAHLAVAMGQRVVMIMHGTGVEQTCPYQHKDWVVSASSGQSADVVGMEEVQAACARALGERGVKAK